MQRRVIEAAIRQLEQQRDTVGSAEERVMLDLVLGDWRAGLVAHGVVERSVARKRTDI